MSRDLSDLPKPYEPTDVSPFSPSGAIYFMDGYSDATVRLRGSEEELSFSFEDTNTSIAATAPLIFDEQTVANGVYVPIPPPLSPEAFYPPNAPDHYRRDTTMHMLQVVSMNMTDKDGSSRLLIGLPYAEGYPKLFFSEGLLEEGSRGAASYGVVQSLTEFVDEETEKREIDSNGYPARSFFGIFHIIETPAGILFNKKGTQMELQPDREGKLATALPPIPFVYELANGPIPLYDVEEPEGEPVADLVAAHHGSDKKASMPSVAEWPYHQPDLAKIEAEVEDRGTGRG